MREPFSLRERGEDTCGAPPRVKMAGLAGIVGATRSVRATFSRAVTPESALCRYFCLLPSAFFLGFRAGARSSETGDIPNMR